MSAAMMIVFGLLMLNLLCLLDAIVYLRTPYERRIQWPKWYYWPLGALIARLLEKSTNKKFAISLYAIRFINDGFETHHQVGVIEAASKEEALGKAYMDVRRDVPSSDGWERHDARVMEVTPNE